MKTTEEPSDDELWSQLQESLKLLASHSQQLADRQIKRGQIDLHKIDIQPQNELDLLLMELQAESERNKEDNRLNGNAIRAMSTGLFTANALLKRILKKNGK